MARCTGFTVDDIPAHLSVFADDRYSWNTEVRVSIATWVFNNYDARALDALWRLLGADAYVWDMRTRWIKTRGVELDPDARRH